MKSAMFAIELAKKFRKSPAQIASDLALKIKPSKEIESIKPIGPYINFFYSSSLLAQKTIQQILKEGDKYGSTKINKGKTLVIDFSSPNIAKPFGVGHLRSTIIGNSIANIADFIGYKTVRINYLGDWGTPFGKVLAGYKSFGSATKLKKNPINHLYEVYVLANEKKMDDEGRVWYKKMESGDKIALDLWKKFRTLSIQNFNQIYKKLGIKFDVTTGESYYNKKMEPVINKLKSEGLLKDSEGAQIVDLTHFNLGVLLIKKSDGATLYATKDLAMAIDRYQKYKFTEMFYEVGSEQKHYFSQLFKTLELLGNKWADNCEHIDHGLYLDKDGKKLSTRKGKTIFMEDLLAETQAIAESEIKKRSPKLSKKEITNRAEKITRAAIFYGDLKNFRRNDAIFDIEKFLSFEGDTGPYLLYTYARAKSILNKSKVKQKITQSNVSEKEKSLILKLDKFQEIILQAYKARSPNIIANYAYHLAQSFNEFYHSEKVLGSQNEAFKLSLVTATATVLKNSLKLLGMDVTLLDLCRRGD